jgi:hypothetical protein
MTIHTVTGVETSRRELFLLAARALADGQARVPTERFADLADRVAVADQAWLERLIGWMGRHRVLAHLRLAAVAELLRVRQQAGVSGTRRVVDQALQRADEPGELLAHWIGRYGKSLPKPLKRGVADAAVRLYDELAVATYDSPGAPLRFADVLALTHPAPRDEAQTALFSHVVVRRRGLVQNIPDSLPLLRTRRSLYQIPARGRPRMLEHPDAAEMLARAAISWPAVERWLLGAMTGPAWEAVIPAMGYRDRLAHLADFDRSEVPDEVARRVAADLVGPASVVRAGVTPLEITAAARSVPASRWSQALRQALELSLVNVPALADRTLVLVDRTALMAGPASAHPPLSRAEAAAVFGAALAVRSPSVDLVRFGTAYARVPTRTGESLADVMERFGPIRGSASPTHTRHHLDGFDRLVILTNPDAVAETADAITIPGQEHIITDACSGWYSAIPNIERARTGSWPF